MGRLDGKVALISGGARGQGEAEARLFVAEGARVVIGDVLHDLGNAVATDLGQAARYAPLDVTDPGAWEAVVAETEQQEGRLDVLVNNAGVLTFGVSLVDVSLEDYMRVVNINQVGTFLGMKYAIPAIARGGRGGAVVNISSTNGFAGYGGTIAYTASKFAVRGMTKTAALEFGKLGIRINSIHPGGIETPMIITDDANLPTDEERAALADGIPVGRFGQPEEVARLALFLASDEASYCTGAEFLADGGALAGTINPEVQPRP